MARVHLKKAWKNVIEYPPEFRVKVYESECWADWVDCDSDRGLGHGVEARAMFKRVQLER